MNKEPRLRFTDEERSEPALEKPIRKAEKAVARADKAQANIPKKKVRQTVIDPDTGKKTSKLTFEDKKKPPSKVSQGVREAPVHLVAGKLHKEIRETEQDNVGVESAHKSEEAVETGAYLVREGYRSHKLKPYRKAAQAERQLEKANVNVLYQKSLQENPQFASNPFSRWQQKQAIKKQYAAAKHAGQTAGNTAQAASKTGKAARTVKEKAQQAGAFVMRHKKGFLMAGVLFLITCMLMNTMSSCSMMAQSIGSVLSGTTYPSDDPEMLAVEADYAAREVRLQEEIDNIESSHPGYDEYRYDLGMIGHDPHELAAFLSAVLQGYTQQSAQAELARVFAAQYQLTLTEEVEIRYRTETSTDPETGETTSEEVPYEYYILNVKLTSKPISAVASELLTPEQMEMYQVYRQTMGNKPLLFGGGSPDMSNSEDLTGVQFVNGTRPGNPQLVELAVEADYAAREVRLQEEIDNIESSHPGYDEYRYDLGMIGHDPHELAAFLSAVLQGYTQQSAQAELARVFAAQYQLTLTEEVEIRYRTETSTDPETGETTSEEVPYEYYILNVKLTSKPISAVASELLTPEQMEMYQVYRQTMGNKPLLFGGGSPDMSNSEDLTGVQFVNGTRPGNPQLVELAKRQVGNVGGYPYWSWYGFDSRVEWCACFVSWCYNQAGKSEPRFAGCEWQGVPWFQSHGQWGARGYNNLAPGDAIFFDWDLDGTADHVGIVIGTDGSRVYTVEGNSGDACKIKSYDLNYQSIKGYGLMNW